MNDIKPRTVYLLRRTDKEEDDGIDLYVGSTSRKNLNTRLCLHRCDAIRVGNESNRLYKRMRKIGLGNWEALPLLSRTCDSKTIRKLERKWCTLLKADLKSNSPFSGFENKKEYDAKYYTSNKGKIIQRGAEYRKLSKQNKVFHCNVCEKSFGSGWYLRRHFGSLKHQYTYLNSLD